MLEEINRALILPLGVNHLYRDNDSVHFSLSMAAVCFSEGMFA